MKFTRNKNLHSDFLGYLTKESSIAFSPTAEPSIDLNQATLISFTKSKIVFSGGDTTYELRGNFGTGTYTQMTDLLAITASFKSLALFQMINGELVLNMVLETQTGDLSFSVASLLEAFEDGTFYKFFAGNDTILGTDFTNGDEVGALGQVVTGDLLRAWDGNDKLYGYGSNDELWGGSGKDLLDGGTGDDALFGGSGADNLYGNLGNDRMYGGSGADKFVFDTELSSLNKDTIEDFARRTDKLVLDDDIFTRFAKKTTVDAKHLKVATAAGDADDYLVFNPNNNTLYYDVDGNGNRAAVEMVTLVGVAALGVSDFQVIA